MSPRKALLALAGITGLSGMAAGEPPISPVVEGREPNPIAREFHEAEVPVGGYVAGRHVEELGDTSAWLLMVILVRDMLLDHLTFPLGMAVWPDEALGA